MGDAAKKDQDTIVMLSAESAARQRRMGASAGCSGYLTKPVPKSEVLKALHYFSNCRDVNSRS